MKSGVLPLAGWGASVIAVAVLGATVFGLQTLPTALLAGGGALSVAVGVAALGRERRRPRAVQAEEPELLVLGSVATSALAFGVVIALVGAAAVGPAVFGLGAGLVVLGAGGIVREQRAGRRMLHEAREVPR